MLQSHALRGLLLILVVASCAVKAEVFVDDDIQAVVIEAPIAKQEERSTRNKRQVFVHNPIYPYPPLPIVRQTVAAQPVPRVDPPASCVTVQNATGRCMTINECYPTWKVFHTEAKDSWAFGLYNMCFKEGPEGRQVTGVCCPDSQTEKTSFGDEAVLENNEARSSSASKEKVSEKSPRKTACLLSDSQKQKIRNSQCIRSNVKRDSVEQSDDFIAKQLNWPFVKFDPQNVLLTQRFVWRYRRAVDLGINRIIGGSPINPHQFKFVAALLTEDYQGRVRQFCGGSVIDEYHVLTAAHCVASYTESDVRRLRVQLGVHDIKNTPSKSTHKVDRIIRHIDFSQRTLDNDVAILTLNTPAPIYSNSNVKQVCMLSGSNTLENRNAIVSGWGSLKFGTSKFPKELHSVNVKVWNNPRCNSNYGSQAPGGITDRMLCASLPGKDSCQGDSGGALFTCKNSADCTQIGIVSWGIGCAQAQYPGVYTRVTEMIDWIQRITSCY